MVLPGADSSIVGAPCQDAHGLWLFRMTHDEMVRLIQGGIPSRGGVWADFGAGTGNFTRALRERVGETAAIYAIDQDRRALAQLQRALPEVHTQHADFTQPLDLPPLDGILMANALHWIQRQEAMLRQIAAYLRPGGHFLIVEYETAQARSYIPHPVPYSCFESLADGAGLADVRCLGERRSPSGGIGMYAAVGTRIGGRGESREAGRGCG